MLHFGKHWLPRGSTSAQAECLAVASHSCQTESTQSQNVILPTEYYSDCDGVQDIADNFVSALSHWLGTDIKRVSIEGIWQQTRPHGISVPFFEYFKKVEAF